VQTEFVTMVHPDLPGQPYKAPKQGVGQLKRAGWRLASEEPPPSAPQPPEPVKTTEPPASAGGSSLEAEPPKRRRASKEGD